MITNGRPEFREWVDNQADPGWGLMPLTHICKSLIAGDIVRDGMVEPEDCKILERSLAYFFYGRPAYRATGDGPVKSPAACPFCFIFNPLLIKRAQAIHPFDTGAFASRLYSHVIMDEMKLEDYNLEDQVTRPNRLIRAVYGDRISYYDGDPSKISAAAAGQGEFLARSYIDLVRSYGRNEPDDRVGTIEVVFGDPVFLEGNLMAVVCPDILWNDVDRTAWLAKLDDAGVDILPFRYLHARDPEHHHAMIEVEVRSFYEKHQFL